MKVIMFDVGGVLIRFDSNRNYTYLSELAGIDEGKARVKIDKWAHLLEIGKISLGEFERGLARELGIERKKIKWVEYFAKRSEPDKQVIRLVERVCEKGIAKVAFLSNIDKARYRYVLKMLPLSYFDYRFASCYIGSRKPDPAIYRYTLKKFGCKADDVLFIDNTFKNVEAARAGGMHAVEFEGASKLAHDKIFRKFAFGID